MQSERGRRGLRVVMGIDPDPIGPCQPVKGLELLTLNDMGRFGAEE